MASLSFQNNPDGVSKDLYVGAVAAATITPAGVVIPKNFPIFDAYASGNQAVTSGVFSKMLFNIKSVDSKNAFDMPNSRFQPTVAGWYEFFIRSRGQADAGFANMSLELYKNGVRYSRVVETTVTTTIGGAVMCYLNGTTDYVEPWAAVVATTNPYLATASDPNGSYGSRITGKLVLPG
jgi:hypothetical protein